MRARSAQDFLCHRDKIVIRTAATLRLEWLSAPSQNSCRNLRCGVLEVVHGFLFAGLQGAGAVPNRIEGPSPFCICHLQPRRRIEHRPSERWFSRLRDSQCDNLSPEIVQIAPPRAVQRGFRRSMISEGVADKPSSAGTVFSVSGGGSGLGFAGSR